MNTAQTLRAALKEAGFNARKVSVRHERYSMGSSVHVTIRDASVTDIAKVREIAETAESIRRCPITHEILSGGNTYVHVHATDDVRAAWAEQSGLVDKLETAFDKLVADPARIIDVDGDWMIEIDGSGYVVATQTARQSNRVHVGYHKNTPNFERTAADLFMAAADPGC